MRCAVIAVAAATFAAMALPGAADDAAEPVGPIKTVTTSDGTTVRIDVSGKGAVWCGWGIAVEMARIAQQCPAAADTLSVETLNNAIRRIEDFIVTYSTTPVSHADIAARKASDGAAFPIGCTEDTLDLYRAFVGGDPDRFSAWVDDFLSVPREPVMNPCL